MPVPAPSGPPQYLPATAEWCLEAPAAAAASAPPSTQASSRRCIQLEVPATPRQYAWGLMGRPPLAPLTGMWFRFQPAEPVKFWMHRTPSPLDMLFLRDGRVIAIEAAAAPCPRLPCRSYGPAEPSDGVVELAAGEAARLGIRVGSPALIRPLPLKPLPLKPLPVKASPVQTLPATPVPPRTEPVQAVPSTSP